MKKLLLVVVVALMASPAQLSAKTKKKNKGVDTTLVSKDGRYVSRLSE